MAPITGIVTPSYPADPALGDAGRPRRPVTGVDWFEARAFCAFLGKRLPTREQWTRALRGGERLPDGAVNTAPDRNYPWGTMSRPAAAKVKGVGEPGVADVGTYPEDVSVEGVYDLAGNAAEWSASTSDAGPTFRIVRGGSALYTPVDEVADYVANENPRSLNLRYFGMGLRCVVPSR